MSDQLIQRAGLLLQQKKYKEAESILGGLFAQDPTNITVLALLSEVKIQQELYTEALGLVNSAIGYDPSSPFLFYKRASVYIQLHRFSDAENDLDQAIAIDPFDANYFALFALLKIDRKKFEEARVLSEKALELDPENIAALNARSTALLKLNRKEESFHTIQGALREDPDNAYTHANYGWGLLEKGSHKEALHHFAQALQKDPTLKLAQAGMAEALKARYWLYRSFLKYAFWMGNLTAKYQWIFIVGIFMGSRALNALAKSNPAVAPFILPFIILLAAFAFSTWIITPVSNLFLRLNTYGKHLLSAKEKMASNFVGVSALIALSGVLLLLITGMEPFSCMIFFGISMMIPLSVIFHSVKNGAVLKAYAALMAVLGITGIVAAFSSGDLVNSFIVAYLIGFFLFQWVANFLITRGDGR